MQNGCRLFIGKLSARVTEKEMQEEFDVYGTVAKIDLKAGYAFVFYENEDDAQDAIRGAHGKEMGGSSIVVEVARSSRDGQGKPKPLKRMDLRVVIFGLDRNISWQDLKDWARAAGDVTFTNIFQREGEPMGVVEFAVRHLPLGLSCRTVSPNPDPISL
ncbi:putative SF2/ASF splicing modulator Srp30 [Ochromonadaceae sp. CCMP2298]|nr:putative SF2/ASF splicing modulator Srp30 [Ochromonadaceae sp. CCMP2298]